MTIMTHTAEQPRKAHPDEVANRIATKFVGELVNKYGCIRADIDSTISDGRTKTPIPTLETNHKAHLTEIPKKIGHVNAVANIRYNGWQKEIDYNNLLKMTAQDVLESVGYNEKWLEFKPESIISTAEISPQSEEIFKAQTSGYMYGDSRPKWGYYTTKTESGLPISTELIGNIIYHIDNAFKENELPIGPDGKAQLMMDGDKISKITLAVQEEPATSHDEIVKQVNHYLHDILGDSLCSNAKVNVNTSGSFVHGWSCV